MKVLITTSYYQSTGSSVTTKVVELSIAHVEKLKEFVNIDNKRKDAKKVWGVRHEILELED